jgi:O-acetylserine/cysteine efflux transporter
VSTSPQRLSGADLLAALAVIVIWGCNFVAMKFALRDFTPFQLGAARYVFAALPLVLLVKPPKLAWKWVVAYGMAQGVGQFGFLFCALQAGMTAALASVLMQTQVFFTVLFGFFLLHEKLSRPLIGGLGLAAAALLCFSMTFIVGSGPASGVMGAVTALGFVLNLCAAAMWAASNIIARKAQAAHSSYDALALVVWSSLAPIIPFVALTLWFDPPATRWHWTHAPLTDWVSVAYLGWIATIAAYAMWTGLLKRHPANRVSPFSLGVPVIGLTAGVVVLGETITSWQWGGIALVVAALVCVMFGGRLKILSPRA